ncbi:MAG: S-layer homology domain-containing protein [Candidatus Peregrinibacteria bacterium]
MHKFCHKHGLKAGVLLLVVSVASLFAQVTGDFSHFLTTSIISYPEHEPFDGTVYPVQKVPDWVHLDSSKWNLSYGALSADDLIDIPFYDPDVLKISTDNLKWGDSNDDLIRNSKITYSVPYMGSYKLDGLEYGGSHLAVDIKVPMGTPVYSIANGTVVKVSNQSSGFGHHVVVQHTNFPSLEDPNKSVTLFSSYNHLSDIFVSEGDVVKKGEQIALSGQTGTATTPHVHFQIDTTDAPWHPFWPFTWQEASDAGLDFFTAVNAGLGKEKAMATTINPLKYVQKYMDGTIVSDSITASSYVTDETVTLADSGEVTETFAETDSTEITEVIDVTEPEEVLAPPVLTFKIDVRPKYYVGQESDFSIFMIDQYGNTFDGGAAGEMTISSLNSHVTASPSIITNRNFDSSGRLNGKFVRMDAGRDKLALKTEDKVFYSGWFEIEAPEVQVSFSDVPENSLYFAAISYLASEGIVNGYSDGTFRPDQVVSRVEALKFIFEGIKEILSSGNIPFPDVSVSEWYGKYLYTAYNKGVVDGYPDGTFRPTNTVNKAEFYKILFNGMGVDVNPNVTAAPFSDVSKDAWFAPYVAYAKQLGIIDSNIKELHPENGMTRGEVAYAIYKLMLVTQ